MVCQDAKNNKKDKEILILKGLISYFIVFDISSTSIIVILINIAEL